MFEELKTLIAVVELKNFTKAAERLSLSQPSVSVHIKNLENYFDVKLIDRSVKQKSISITEKGYHLYKRAKEITDLMDLTYQELKDNTESLSGSIRIGASFTIGEYLLPKFLSYFSEKYPDINIEVFIENTAVTAQKVKNLSVDIGLIEGNISSSGLVQKYFYEDEMVLAFPYSEKDNLKKEDYHNLISDRNWISRETGSGTREFLDVFFTRNEITPKSILVMGSNFAVKESVKNNMGITLMSKLIAANAERNKDIAFVSTSEKYTRHFSHIISKNVNKNRLVELFLEELEEYSNSLKEGLCIK